jgi:hypothetical protein
MRVGRPAPAFVIFTAALALFAHAPRARAQAWVPAQGEGSLTTTYQHVNVRSHLNNHNEENTRLGRVRTNDVDTSFEYGVTDRLAVDAELAFVASRYLGTIPHGPPDVSRTYHPQFQDAYVGVRYNLLSSPLALTPFVGAVIPTHDYETRGHSAVGRGFHELAVGVNAGRSLDPLLKDVYVQARYTYSMQKRFEGLNLNRSNLDWEAGWQARRSLSFRFLGAVQVTHGGLTTPLDRAHLDEHVIDFHDRAARSEYVRLGGGATYNMGKAFGIYGAYATTVFGRNTHAAGGFALGFGWSFSRGLEVPQL